MNKDFNFKTRQGILDNLSDVKYDIIIIGGGITGAGVLRDAALRGLNALIIEKGDFSCGTSSRSSKLLHGGLRYLAKFHFHLTIESLKERDLLYKQNNHLIYPMPFLFPIYKGDKNGPFMIRIGLYLYTMLAAGALPWPSMLKPEQVKQKAPLIRTTDLLKSGLYYDTRVDDSRLTLLTILSGIENGGSAVNYAPVVGFEKQNGKIIGVRINDLIGNKEYTAKAEAFINATGVDVDNTRKMDEPVSDSRLMPTKGIHLVIPSDKIPVECTVAFNSIDDKRPLFIIPWGDVSLVGTTDSYEREDTHAPPVLQKDVDYLLRSLNHYFPNASVENKDIISVFSGVRPLVLPKGVEPGPSASDLSREDAIYEDPSGLVSMAGGKLTTYRNMAERLLDKAIDHLSTDKQRSIKPCSTKSPLVSGSSEPDTIKQQLIKEFELNEKIASHLVQAYGSKAKAVAIMGKEHNELEPILAGKEYILAEARYCARYESPMHLTDILTRRIRMALWTPGKGIEAAERISTIAASELDWDQKKKNDEIELYKQTISREYSIVG